ncbi:MAG TPA: glucuronate isomerase, partial [Agromyces sp.]|nr:glucuronate isomerase [Agromyces sp.]
MASQHHRDPDRLLPADRRSRDVARALYERVAAAPIISPHGHVPVDRIANDTPFADPASLLVSEDHYITRLLHSAGLDLSALGVGGGGADPRQVWTTLAEHWHLFAGTASGYWLEEELSEVLRIDEPLDAASADRIYDGIAAKLSTQAFRPRALFRSFGIEVLATTDDPLDDLHDHARIMESDLDGRVIPTFRPDRYLDPDAADFAQRLERLLSTTGQPGTFEGYLAALESRREHFIRHGAVSADHGVEEAHTLDLGPSEGRQLFQAIATG